MASAYPSCSADNFSCPICLNVLNSPVSTPCGHNFCRACIEESWRGQSCYKCPLCNQLFKKRPDLRVNYLIANLSEQLRSRIQVNEQHCVKPGEVPCDVCTGTKLKAVKSCLVCLISYCHTHLEPHQRFAGLKRHPLVTPMDRLEDRICKKHSQLLELFCHTEQVFVCQHCTVMDHKSHAVVPIKEEYEEKMAQLWKIHFEVQQMIQWRQQQEIYAKYSTENQAEGPITELQQEIQYLTNESLKMMQVSQTEDHLHFLQTFRIPEIPPHIRDGTTVEVCPQPYVRTASRFLDQLEETLNMGTNEPPVLTSTLKKYARKLTLDPNTAHGELSLSEDNRKVTLYGDRHSYPDHPDRFDSLPQVLCREGLTGRCYWVVEWEGEVDIGVTYRGITRRGGGDNSRLGWSNNSWILRCYGNVYTAWYKGSRSGIHLRPAGSYRVGVYLDRPAGTLSFYSVSPGVGGSSDTLTHIHTYHSAFTQDLYPGFFLNTGSVSLCWL